MWPLVAVLFLTWFGWFTFTLFGSQARRTAPQRLPACVELRARPTLFGGGASSAVAPAAFGEGGHDRCAAEQR